MEAPGPLRGAQPSVELQKLLADIFDNVLSDFIKLSQPDSSGLADRESADQRKYRLLQHLHGTRQQLLRALALLNWKPWKVLNELVDHDRVLDIAASHVRTMTEVVQQMRQQAVGRIMAGSYLNMYDVNTALEVLTTGTYQELPSIILQRPPLFQPPPASAARQRARLAHVTHLIRARLVQVSLPPGLQVVSVSNGTAVLQAEGLYEAKLTLVPSEPLLGETAADGAPATAAAAAIAGEAGGSGGGSGYTWTAAGATAAADPVAAAATAQRWKWRLIHFVLAIGVSFYDPRQPGQILNTCNFHMVLAADNAAYLRRQRQGGGATRSTLSESTATPAASGLQLLGAAGGAGGGGGSLAAAVRRMEDDEMGAPLAVMHAILTDVAGRLLADELAAAARALAAPGSRWHGHITVKPSQLLHPGIRIEYWTQAPPLLSHRALPPPEPGGDWRSVKPGPPYLELGMGEGGCVEVLNSPSSLHKPVSVSKLRLDTFRVNVEEVLMRAANMSSQYQLLQIRQELKVILAEAIGKRVPMPTLRLSSIARQLWCRDGCTPQSLGTEDDEQQADTQAQAQPPSQQPPDVEAAGAPGGALSSAGDTSGIDVPMDVDTSAPSAPAATAGSRGCGTAAAPSRILPPTAPPPEMSGLIARGAPEEEVAGPLVVLSAPVLEYLVSGTTELKIGKHLFSGRLTLRPGQDERDEGSLDHAATIAMNEDYVNQAAAVAYNSGVVESYPARRALKEACNALCHVLQRTHTSTDATHFIQAARRASLHISRLPHGMLDAFSATTPGLAIEPRPREKVATWALQSVPFPPDFPPLEPVGPDTPPMRVPQCLTFFFQSRLSLSSPHVLIVCSCNKQLRPIKVLSCIPVPASTYHLPEHVVAAYMAVSTAANGGGGNAVHGNAMHSPHGGGNSPRGAANGHDGSGHSPETSPRRESLGAAAAGIRSTGVVGGAGVLRTGGHGSDVVVAGTGQASSAPSLPSGAAASPPHSHSYSQSQGRVASSGTAVSGVHPPRGGSSAGNGVTASGRPTGQQVAVMIAHQQLSSVVKWCRRRMVWEVLLVQLKAVGATFAELCNPPCQRVRVTTVAGTALPCHIVRRRGLGPARIGPTCLELELGPDALAGQFTARLYGRFLCSPACAPLDTKNTAAGGGVKGFPVATGAAGFVLEEQTAVPASAQRSGNAGSELSLVCLRRQYCLERGESALTMVQEVSAVIRMQTLLARLEMTARPVPSSPPGRGLQAQRLAVLLPPPPPPSGSATALGAPLGGADGPGRPLQLWNQQQQYSQQQQQQQQLTVAAAAGACMYKPGHGEVGEGGQPPGVYGDSGGAGGYRSLQPAAKRMKTEQGYAQPGHAGTDTYVNGGWGSWQQQQQQQQQQQVQQPGTGFGHSAGLPNGVADSHTTGGVGNGPARSTHTPDGGGSEAAMGTAAPLSGLTWHWPLVGTLTLEEYGCSTATLRVTPCTAGPRQCPASGADAGPTAAMIPHPLLLQITWAARDVRDPYSGAASGGTAGASGVTPGTSAPAPTPSSIISMPPSPAPGGVVMMAQSIAPVAAVTAAATPPQSFLPGMLPPASAVRPTRQGPSRLTAEPFGSQFSDLVLCTIYCSSGHSLPPGYLQVLEELAEAGEEGKLLDAVAVAAWPISGFCAALRPPVLARYGLVPDVDVQMTMQQPPYCLRIVCRKRGLGVGGSGPVLVDLICQAVGRSYLRVSSPVNSSSAHQQQQAQAQAQAQGVEAAGGLLERQSLTGGSIARGESGAAGAGASLDAPAPSQAILAAVQQLAASRLGSRVHVSVGGRVAVYTGLGQRPAAVPGPSAPLWLLVPHDCVQQAVELVYSALG
ncbi:hypothetical protein Vafri_7499 [Volvox africanus]|uniref:Mediator of RNA polymerase II transcription subunit 14 n=1 Tax=Volvox africanus TaxID=51714 RepID=A0A8J4B112_9CHLO|nr:hypothetical protein Vafri_7499 [Volvox africanus]